MACGPHAEPRAEKALRMDSHWRELVKKGAGRGPASVVDFLTLKRLDYRSPDSSMPRIPSNPHLASALLPSLCLPLSSFFLKFII
ncbi:hypothetical protein NC651_023366 [Populus alba x Populus x berolinensis]|nr:hypothetical protein NC651_023366 [Populus alba x Populus x berolinensis]